MKKPSRKSPAKAGRGRPRIVRGDDENLCAAEGCGRPAYARGLCQTHHRQMTTTGKLRPIRPYRKRSPGTVKIGGLRLSPQCADQVQGYAEEKGISLGAAIAFILEEWLLKS
jgi:hypothetical protein